MKISLILTCILLTAVSNISAQSSNNTISLTDAFVGFNWTLPLGLEFDGFTDRWYIVTKPGIVYAIENPTNSQKMNANLNSTIFLNITDRINGGKDIRDERGLLGLAFHPDFPKKPYCYVYYSGNPDVGLWTYQVNYLSRFNIDTTTLKADQDSELHLMRMHHPFPNNNGGQLKFGPVDRFLYLSLGDGGSGADPFKVSQQLSTALGKIIRVDVDNLLTAPISADFNNAINANQSIPLPSFAIPFSAIYGIPHDNPFANNSLSSLGNNTSFLVLPEIWAWGLRNPWRFSFDSLTGQIWASDAGQDRWEEINLIVRGGNYGWSIMEGYSCFRPPVNCVNTTNKVFKMPINNHSASALTNDNITIIKNDDLILPLFAFAHADMRPSIAQSVVIGGYVYRGSQIPELYGKYVFADAIRGFVWSLTFDKTNAYNHSINQILNKKFIVNFAEDKSKELYAIVHDEGKIYKLTKKQL